MSDDNKLGLPDLENADQSLPMDSGALAADPDSQNRTAEARDWAQRLLARKPTIPRYLQRRERPWFRKASALLKRLPG